MITFLLGLPGSGKSYYAVDRIYNNFSEDKEAIRDKKVTFKNCYTNINEFQFDKINNVHNLDFEKLYSILERLYKLYKAKKKDKYLVEFLRRIKLKDTLFVIDEAHNYFDKRDIVLVWWLSYHRHLFHEIILITQNLSLIDLKYKPFSEFFYVAKPQSLTLFKSHFKYNIFCSSRLSEKSKIGNIKVKRSDKVFALYHSGDTVSTSNVVLKFLLISLIMAIVLFFFVYFFVLKNDLPGQNKDDTLGQKVEEIHQGKITPGQNISHVEIEEEKEEIVYSERKMITFNCSRGDCTYKDFSYPPQVIGSYIESEDLKLIFQDMKGVNYSTMYLSSTIEFYNFLFPTLLKDINNEENNNLSIFGDSSHSESAKYKSK